ncbi:MAG: rhodanese-like domain-containing protein [Steroidobacteraceae bacterium]|jgi:rhodanese-related sulfurtransferase
MVGELTPQQFLDRRSSGEAMTLVDVREDWETQLAPTPSPHIHIRMGEIADRLAELDPRDATVVICRSGGRSLEVARFLSARGFGSVFNLAGGILAWSRDVDPAIPQY